jgi:ubiquinone/menaquinone biosynthesis C-methylase UbiE
LDTLIKNAARFKLFPEGTFQCNNIDDPLPYYYKPVIGALYRYRIQQGLSLLSPPYENVLELGYGSGLLLPTLSAISVKLFGVDIASDPDKVQSCLRDIKVKPTLYKNDLLEINFQDNTFDLIVAFSIFEHIQDCGKTVAEIFRILKPEGKLLVGMPRVDKTMVKLFQLIGYGRIEQHHVNDYKNFLTACKEYFILEKKSRVFPFLPSALGLYFNMLLRKAGR